ncbi:MAG: PPC domain-containing DNA-binding protein [Verrucomicrobiales bacterium]
MFHALRLVPGQDLSITLKEWTVANNIQAAAIVTCVGSVSQAHLRLANRDSGSRFHQKMEILALSGTLSPDGPHLHISLADGDGRCIGGHILEGCLVHTTAEIVICEIPNVKFGRKLDEKTGYRELVIIK